MAHDAPPQGPAGAAGPSRCYRAQPVRCRCGTLARAWPALRPVGLAEHPRRSRQRGGATRARVSGPERGVRRGAAARTGLSERRATRTRHKGLCGGTRRAAPTRRAPRRRRRLGRGSRDKEDWAMGGEWDSSESRLGLGNPGRDSAAQQEPPADPPTESSRAPAPRGVCRRAARHAARWLWMHSWRAGWACGTCAARATAETRGRLCRARASMPGPSQAGPTPGRRGQPGVEYRGCAGPAHRALTVKTGF